MAQTHLTLEPYNPYIVYLSIAMGSYTYLPSLMFGLLHLLEPNDLIINLKQFSARFTSSLLLIFALFNPSFIWQKNISSLPGIEPGSLHCLWNVPCTALPFVNRIDPIKSFNIPATSEAVPAAAAAALKQISWEGKYLFWRWKNC